MRNVEANRKSSLAWYYANREKAKATNKQWYKEHPHYKNEYRRLHRKRKPHLYVLRGKRSRLKAYGLTIEQYELLCKLQNNQCAICSKVCKLDVDHCHTSQERRGLLCRSCNLGLGAFHDDTQAMQKAITYLERYKSVLECELN